MKILFICGCLEPGRDGVGDYTRRLAGELIRRGNSCRIIAMNDRKLTGEPVWKGDQLDIDTPVPALRLGQISLSQKIRETRVYLEGYSADVCCVQYVPLAFHDRGLTRSITHYLKSIPQAKQLHISFHEVWVTALLRTNQKMWLLSKLQKWAVQSLLSACNPQLIDATIDVNCQRVRQLGFECGLMPIFGNIPRKTVTTSRYSHLGEKFAKTIFYFGSTPRESTVDAMKNAILHSNLPADSNIGWVFAGRLGSGGTKFIEHLREPVEITGGEIVLLGELKATEVSELMQVCHVGVVRNSPNLLAKSGVAHAMAEHQMSLWCPELGDATTCFADKDPRVPITGRLREALANEKPSIEPPNVSSVCSRYIERYSESSGSNRKSIS